MRRVDEAATREAFESALRQHEQAFGSFFLARFMGLDIRFEGEVCRIAMPVKDFLFNPQGSLHGGIIASVLDISMGHLIHHVTGQGAATLEMKVSYMKAASKGLMNCEGRFVKHGRRVSYLESTMRDETGAVVAAATATWFMPQEASPAPAGG